MRWPNDAKCGVLVTVDLDGDLPFLAQGGDHALREKSRSVGQYGTDVGATRVLRVFADAGIRATWFVPGQVAREHGALVRAIAAHGHAIGVHGDQHLDFDGLTLEEQLRELTAGQAALADVLGSAPTGFRSPAGEWDLDLPSRAAEHGFEWSSSLPADDMPFTLAEELIELPFRYELEDYQYLAYNLDPPFPPGLSRITPIATVESNWWREYLGAAHYGTMFLLRLNAELIGTPGRARMLSRFLTRIQRDGRAAFLTCPEAAVLARSTPSPEAEHPYQRFERLFRDPQ